jgi:hypothetical protein
MGYVEYEGHDSFLHSKKHQPPIRKCICNSGECGDEVDGEDVGKCAKCAVASGAAAGF